MYCPNKEGKVKPHFARVDFTLGPVQSEAIWGGVIEKDTMWSFPVGNSAKSEMRAVYKDWDRYRGQAKRLALHIEKEFEANKIYEQFVEHVYGKRIEKFDINKLPKISLVTSIFKADEYIEQFMDDITRQTIFKNKCEWIIINPNSPGNEEEIIKRYIEKYPDNIVYKRLDYDPGIYDTWNMGIQMATGEYITNANADDRKAINSVEEHAKALYQNPEIDLVYADSYIAKESNKRWEDIRSDWQKYNFEQFSLEAMLRGNPPHNNPMWRKSVHDKNGYFDQKYKSAGDWDFWLRCAFNDSKFMKINDTLGVYYFNPVGMSTNPEHDSWKKQHEKEIFMKYLEIYQERMNK